MKKGQLTVFIIIGILILFVIGTFLYINRTQVEREIEAARPRIAEVPQFVQPVKDSVDQCILRLGTDGLRRIGDRGGYIDDASLQYNPIDPTEGNAVKFSPGKSPPVAYWWHMSSPNSCQNNCRFDTQRPNLYRTEGGVNIEDQLSAYVSDNLPQCLGNFDTYRQQGCTVTALSEPQVTANVATDDVFFVGDYPLRVNCQDQTFDVREYYTTIPLNLKEMYELALNVTNTQAQSAILEQATIQLLTSYSGLEPGKLPPFRDLNVGPPSRSVYWIKHDILTKLKNLFASHIPLIQVSSTKGYRYISAPTGINDPELYELTYNRNWFLPLEEPHPNVAVNFAYLNWWTPYFDLNCNGQLCTADTANVFLQFLSFGLQRYEFAYDISYPVMVELRNPDAFNGEGYTFRIMLEQNLRNSKSAMAEAPPFDVVTPTGAPSIFCDPQQQTSAPVQLNVRDGDNFQPLDEANIVYSCSQSTCPMGQSINGTFLSSYPTCLGGILRISKPGYATFNAPFSTPTKPANLTIDLEPERPFLVTLKNYELYKLGKRGQWQWREGAPTNPRPTQTTTIQLQRLGTPYDQPYFNIIQLDGDEEIETTLIPGTYKVIINSFLNKNLTIPVDRRCKTIKKFLSKEKKCYNVPDKPIKFNEDQPFPYGNVEYEVELTREQLRGRTQIEFHQVILAIDKLKEGDRIVEDLNQLNSISMHAKARMDKIKPEVRR